MRRELYLFMLISLLVASGIVYSDGDHIGGNHAGRIRTDTDNFNGALSSSDDTVQKSLDTLDDSVASGGETLQTVTDRGATTDNVLTIYDELIFTEPNTNEIILISDGGADQTEIYLPATDGTLALLDDIDLNDAYENGGGALTVTMDIGGDLTWDVTSGSNDFKIDVNGETGGMFTVESEGETIIAVHDQYGFPVMVSKQWIPYADNTYDLGRQDAAPIAGGARRWRNLYLAGQIIGTGSGEQININAATATISCGNRLFIANAIYSIGSSTEAALALYSNDIYNTRLSNLTTNGFVKTSGSVGTISVDTTTYLTIEADDLPDVTSRGATTTDDIGTGTVTLTDATDGIYQGALELLITPDTDNVFVGHTRGDSATTGDHNVVVGYNAGSDYGANGDKNTMVGSAAGADASGLNSYFNTCIGYSAGSGAVNNTGVQNTYLGYFAGQTNTSGAKNVYVGHYAGFNWGGTYDNTFILGNDWNTYLLWGDFANNWIKCFGAIYADNGAVIAARSADEAEQISLDHDGTDGNIKTTGAVAGDINMIPGGGDVKVTGNITISDAGTIGSATDVDIMTLGADGTTTFSVFPVTPSAAPDADYEAANKKYVDDMSNGLNNLDGGTSSSTYLVTQSIDAGGSS